MALGLSWLARAHQPLVVRERQEACRLNLHLAGVPAGRTEAALANDRAAQICAGLATLWLVVMVTVDVMTARPHFVALFALAPLIACAALPTRITAVFAGVAIFLSAGSGWWNHSWASGQQIVRIADVILVSAAATVVAVVRVRREQQFARVAAIAEVAQRAILPTLPTRFGSVAIGARYLSAAQDAVVGGDLYDWYHSATRLRFLVGDVRGKGIAAVGQAARVIRAFRQAAPAQASLPAVGHEMSAYLAPFFDDEEFVTGLLVDASDATRLTLVSCGHPPALLIRRDGHASLLEAPPGLPLGLGDTYDGVTVPWGPGDRLLMYTDGLSEARDSDGRFLPLLTLAPLLRAETVDDALDALLDAVHEHVPSGQLADDLAVVLLENLGVDHRTPTDEPDPVQERVWANG